MGKIDEIHPKESQREIPASDDLKHVENSPAVVPVSGQNNDNQTEIEPDVNQGDDKAAAAETLISLPEQGTNMQTPASNQIGRDDSTEDEQQGVN